MKAIKLIGLMLLLSSNGISTVFGQSNSSITYFNKSNSPLTDDCILKIQLDEIGNLWVLTNFGLAKFDGTKLVLQLDVNHPEQAYKDFIISKNNIWLITSTTNELVVYNQKKSWTYHKKKPNVILASFSGQNDKEVFISTNLGIISISTDKKNANLEYNNLNQKDEKLNSQEHKFDKQVFDNSNNIYGYGKEVPKNGQGHIEVTHYLGYTNSYKDKKERIWVGTYFDGLIRLTGKNTFQKFEITNNPIWAFTEDSSGSLILGVWGEGIMVEKDNTFQQKKISSLDLDELFINSLLLDKFNNLWIGTSNKGLIQVKDFTIKDTIIQPIEKTVDNVSKQAIDDIELISVYPNPVTSGLLYVQSNSNSTIQYLLTDMVGKEVLRNIQYPNTNNAKFNKVILNVGSLESGSYFLKSQIGDEIIINKVLILNH